MAGSEEKQGRFVRVAELRDVPVGGGRVIKRDRKQIALLRVDEERVYAIDNRCPHEGYPLSEGTLKDCVLTCDWHNWKFDLRSGECLRGGEDVRSYPLRIEDGAVWLDLHEEVTPSALPRAMTSFEEAVDKRDLGRAARDAARLLELGASPEALIASAAEHAAARLEWGWDHGLTVAAECVRALPLYQGREAVIPVVQAVAAVTDRALRMPVRRQAAAADAPASGDEGARVFRRLVEEEEHDRAEALFVAALAGGMGREEAMRWLFPVASDHFLNYGHGLIYTVRAFQMLERIGWQHAPKLLPCLAFQLAWSTREDRLPYMRRFQGLLRELEPELGALFELQQRGGWSGSFDGEALFTRIVDGRLEDGFAEVREALRAGVPFRLIADEVSAAGAERCLRFDERIDRDPKRDEGWLDVTHVLTHANAVRTAFAMSPSPELLRGLFYGAWFVHYVHTLDRTPAERGVLPDPTGREQAAQTLLTRIEEAVKEMETARALALTRGYLAAGHDEAKLKAWLTRFAIADSAAVDIMLAHTIKTSVAAAEELAAIESPRRELPLLAAIRFLASPKRERWVYSWALKALAMA